MKFRLVQTSDGMKLRLLRIAAGLSQESLAALVPIPRSRVCDHERGRRTLDLEDQARVKDVLATILGPAVVAPLFPHLGVNSNPHQERVIADGAGNEANNDERQ